MKAENHPKGRPTKTPPPETIFELIARKFYANEEHDSEKSVHLAYQHHFSRRGSGMRAILAYNTSLQLGLKEEDAVILAATVECLHNASLVQDDMQDSSSTRRGQASVYSSFGEATALGLTNCLLTTSFACLSEFSNHRLLPRLIQKVNEAVAETVHGQTDELLCGPDEDDINKQLSSSMRKSGPLFSLAIELPLLASEEDDSLKNARHACYCFGLAYQIFDDLLDREQDASAGSNGNIALMLESVSDDSEEAPWALQLTHSLLHQTRSYAARLPKSSGWPLFELAAEFILKVDQANV